MLVERILPAARPRLVTVADTSQLIEAAGHLGRAGTDIVVVTGPDGGLAGIVTKTDIVRQISRCQGRGCTVEVSSVMTRDAFACRPGEWLNEVWARMKERGLKNIPVTDEDSRPLGVLNARDALQALMQEVENEESLLRDYVMCVGYH